MDIWNMRVQILLGTNTFCWVYDELNVEGKS